MAALGNAPPGNADMAALGNAAYGSTRVGQTDSWLATERDIPHLPTSIHPDVEPAARGYTGRSGYACVTFQSIIDRALSISATEKRFFFLTMQHHTQLKSDSFFLQYNTIRAKFRIFLGIWLGPTRPIPNETYVGMCRVLVLGNATFHHQHNQRRGEAPAIISYTPLSSLRLGKNSAWMKTKT